MKCSPSLLLQPCPVAMEGSSIWLTQALSCVEQLEQPSPWELHCMCQEQGEDLKLKHGRAIPGCTPGKLDFSSGTVTLLNTCMWSSSLSEEPRQLDKPSLKGMVMYISFLCPWDFPGKNTGMGTISFSRGSSWPRDQIHVSCIGRQVLFHWSTWEAHTLCYIHAIKHCIIISNETHSMWPSGKTCRIYCYLKNSTCRTAIAYVGYIHFHK